MLTFTGIAINKQIDYKVFDFLEYVSRKNYSKVMFL